MYLLGDYSYSYDLKMEDIKGMIDRKQYAIAKQSLGNLFNQAYNEKHNGTLSDADYTALRNKLNALAIQVPESGVEQAQPGERTTGAKEAEELAKLEETEELKKSKLRKKILIISGSVVGLITLGMIGYFLIH